MHSSREGNGDAAVVKIDRTSAYAPLEHEHAVRANLQTRQEAELAGRRARYRELRDHFGSARVPLEQFGIREFYLTPRQADQLLPPSPERRIGVLVCALTSLQDYVPELAPDQRAKSISPYSDYPEKETAGVLPQDYCTVNDYLVLGHTEGTVPRAVVDCYWRVQGNAELARLLDAAENNGAVAEELRTFVDLCIRYSRQTGRILDLGKDNVIFSGGGAVKLVDALYPVDRRVFDRLGGILSKTAHGEALTYQEQADLMNGRKYVCLVNFLASHLGLSDRLRIQGAPDKLGERWNDVFATLRDRSTRTQLAMATQVYS